MPKAIQVMPVKGQIQFDYPDANKGYKCSCCGSYVKTYRRRLNSNMATCLIALVKHKINGFVKIEDFLLEHGYKRCGDFSYLVHWGFIEKMDVKRNDGSKRNGYYKLTGRGLMFVEGKVNAREKIIIRNNTFGGFDGKEEISIKDALGTKFSFEQLMSE